MRALLVSAFAFNIIAPMSAFAADMPVKAPPAPAPVIYDWTGFYVGANAGVALGAATITSVEPNPSFPAGFVFPPDTPRPGFIGGGQLGANYQLNHLVIGFEGSADWASVTSTQTTSSPLIANFLHQGFGNIDSLFSVAGRVGLAWRSLLIYAKGGGVWDRVNGNTNNFLGSVLTSQAQTPEHSTSGWLLGAGAEWMLDRKWSVKAEYDYIDLGPYSFESVITYSTTPGLVGTSAASLGNWKINTFVTGLNYHY